MYSRMLFQSAPKTSFFLFGPRGTGKTTLLNQRWPEALKVDLLAAETFTRLIANPSFLEAMIPENFKGWIVIDEVQKAPSLLDEVHRLMEKKKHKFILTGSSARKLKKEGTNLLAGRALTLYLSPLTAFELGSDYRFQKALQFGMLPSLWDQEKSDVDEKDYLFSYIQTYLKEEVQQEGLTRNLGSFSRFLETASFSQGEVLNISKVAREAAIKRKLAESYFDIVEDLLIAHRIPVFSKRAKRKLVSHPKFYFFDVGVFRALRPKGPLDTPELIDGAALETLVMQELLAHIKQRKLPYDLFYWRTSAGNEVDFVLYGEGGLVAIEVKRSRSVSPSDLSGLKSFKADYPNARCYLIYGGAQRQYLSDVEVWPIVEFIQGLYREI